MSHKGVKLQILQPGIINITSYFITILFLIIYYGSLLSRNRSLKCPDQIPKRLYSELFGSSSGCYRKAKTKKARKQACPSFWGFYSLLRLSKRLPDTFKRIVTKKHPKKGHSTPLVPFWAGAKVIIAFRIVQTLKPCEEACLQL